jgi:amino acid adenylation domain-containing protein
MAGYWQTLVRSIADAADQPLAALPFLTESERRHIIVDWNLTQRAYARETTLVQLFEQQVRNSPNDLAVVFEEKTLSFSALNRQANQLARYLQSKGVGPESLVGICVERSIQMMVGLLGIWKAGAAYVPLDPAYPAQRLQQMMDDCRARLLLTQESVAAALPETAAGLIYLDRDWPQIGAHPEDDLAVPIRAENLAYVIYTSGSTGKPKGVMVRHNGVANFAAGMDDCLAHDIQGTWLAVTSLSFDISVLELLWTLSRGFRVILQTGGIAGEVESVLKQIRKHEVTHFQCTPSMAGLLLLDPEAPATLAGLRKILVGGEHLPLHLASQLQQIVRGQVINMYGPTETTIWSSSWALHENMANVAIGRPLANTQLYVLDENMEPVPIGAAGELYIGGHGIARGYLSRPELTAEKFVPDHLGQAPGERLYRTGDLARHRADGTIEYLGRIDQQVKLRGYRIELGEIESILATHELVREAAAAVLDDAGSNKRLVGYVVLNLEARTSASTIFIADDLREYLRGKLPDYMVPAMIVELDQMPLTPNGKLDRRSLPKPESASLRKAEYVAPVGDLEVMLAGLWSEFLAIKGVSRNDSFFELGGHSLLAIQLMSRVREVFRVDVQMRSIFEHPTPAAYAGMLRSFELQPAEMEQIAQLMNTIDQMSETEVMAALEQGELGATQQ